jgi:hypothetical protein
MKSPRHIDLTLLREIESASILIRLSSDIDEKLKQHLPYMKEFYERAQAALMFVLKTDAKAEPWRNEAYIRAGLNEVYSLEDAARRGFRSTGRREGPPALSQSEHPLVHVMYSLRHINVHVKPSATSVSEIAVRLNDTHDDREFRWSAVMLADETEADLLGNREVKNNYQAADLRKAMAWLFENQRAFGIGQVFRMGTEVYCREVLAALEKQ